MSELRGLPRIDVNDTARLLKMTRKEQETNKVKGFAPKWSKRLYTVLRKTRMRKNQFHFRYHLGLPDSTSCRRCGRWTRTFRMIM